MRDSGGARGDQKGVIGRNGKALRAGEQADRQIGQRDLGGDLGPGSSVGQGEGWCRVALLVAECDVERVDKTGEVAEALWAGAAQETRHETEGQGQGHGRVQGVGVRVGVGAGAGQDVRSG